MSDQLHQINISYQPKEDRLMLKISSGNGDEYRFWLTRRFTGLLLGVLNKEMDARGGAPSVAGKEETTKMIKKGALEKKYEAEKVQSYPLGENGVLAFRINTRSPEEGNLVLELLPEKGKGITLNLNQALLYMLHNILTQGITQANWALQTESSVSMQVH
ncbi:MAG: hypothetical protein GKR93_16095 [Gammaproteobacteria bacterium]|nr:hypothetical protein [Gammaproteobacteria bacterium]